LTRIGGDGGQTAPWNGLIDEVRISNVARSADWVTTEYNNQNAPGSFITLGTEISSAVDVSVSLVGVVADPQIGTGTVTIGSVVPPDTGGGGTGRSGMRLRPSEDIRLYLEGVAANPRIGRVMLRSDMERIYAKYSSPIRRAEAPAVMPPGMRGLFKKMVPPVVFVYPTPLPKLESAIGNGTVTAHFEEIDEEVLMLLDLL
jgi:hypothetical protein